MKDLIISMYPRRITASQLQKMIDGRKEEHKKTLIGIIEHRLSNRFLKTLKNADPKDLSSFLSIAVCCFLIETLQCFRTGKITKSPKESRKAIHVFFSEHAGHFPGFDDEEICNDFYGGVRNSLLHFADTRDGWSLKKRGDLLNFPEKEINVPEFLKATEIVITKYFDELALAGINDSLWNAALAMLQKIVDDCKVTPKL